MRLFIAIFTVLAITVGLYGEVAKAGSRTEITMSITPLECSIDTVHDGIKQITQIKSQPCQRALSKTIVTPAL